MWEGGCGLSETEKRSKRTLYPRDSERPVWLGTGCSVGEEAREVPMAVAGRAPYITLEKGTHGHSWQSPIHHTKELHPKGSTTERF